MGLSRLDFRDSTRSPAYSHHYHSSPKFTAMAVTGDGCLVVGSRTGDLRLYCPRSSLKWAVTKFPSVGLEISHVDVTFDGKLVLATTGHMLVLFSAINPESGEVYSAFKNGLGKKISFPRFLCLAAMDEKLTGGSKFVSGRFNLVTTAGNLERHIVASVGNFVVVWNLEQIEQLSHECFMPDSALKICCCYRKVQLNREVVEKIVQ